MIRKLTDIQDDEALDVLAEIMDPLVEILSDPKIKELQGQEGVTRLVIVKYVIKEHKTSIIHILAALEGVPVEEYHCNILTLPVAVLEILNDPEVSKLFT